MSREQKIAKVSADRQLAFDVDLFNCIGCRACEVACKQENDLPVGVRYRRVVTQEYGRYPRVAADFISLACNHCAEPACLKVCPVDAYTKRESDGVVLHDQEKCIGCLRCTWACPYGAPQFNEAKKKVEKCHFCFHRLALGMRPACVQTCPGLALDFGPVKAVSARPNRVRTIARFSDISLTVPNIRFRPMKHPVLKAAPVKTEKKEEKKE